MNVYTEISQERELQIKKWGFQMHKPIEWMAILMEEVGEVSREALENHFTQFYQEKDLTNYRKELIQVAAVCVSMIESLDKQNENNQICP